MTMARRWNRPTTLTRHRHHEAERLERSHSVFPSNCVPAFNPPAVVEVGGATVATYGLWEMGRTGACGRSKSYPPLAAVALACSGPKQPACGMEEQEQPLDFQRDCSRAKRCEGKGKAPFCESQDLLSSWLSKKICCSRLQSLTCFTQHLNT